MRLAPVVIAGILLGLAMSAVVVAAASRLVPG